MALSIDFTYLDQMISPARRREIAPEILAAQKTLLGKSGAGSDFLGWLDPAALNSPGELSRLEACAKRLAAQSGAVLVVGIGGSYLGARAAVEYLVSPLYNSIPKKTPDLWFVGNDVSASHLAEVLSACRGQEISVIVSSKSGTTTEPAVAFRVLKKELARRYGGDAASHVVAITDRARGALLAMARAEGYETFVIPDDVGGRFSVLTPVGLLPIALAGVDVRSLIAGAADASSSCASSDFDSNICLQYAAARNLLLRAGRSVELFCGWNPCFTMTAEWLKQLFGESEGKDHKGLFPASAAFTTDLHSLGQFIPDGSRILFETVVSIGEDTASLSVEAEDGDPDGLNYLAGMPLGEINHRAERAVAMAHRSGGTPSIILTTPSRSAYEYGWMLYFFEFACGVSGYTLGVNPFDQPGVEDYKKNMFALLGKPGYEALAAQLSNK